MKQKKFHLKKTIVGDSFFNQIESAYKSNIAYTSENSFEKSKINSREISKKETKNNLKKVTERILKKKNEKKINMKENKICNKFKNIIQNYMSNNSCLNSPKKLGNKIFKNFKITERSINQKKQNKINLKQKIISKSKIGNQREKIGDKDKYIQKLRGYLTSYPSATKRINNTSSRFTIRDKKEKGKSPNFPFANSNFVFNSKCKSKINPKIISKIKFNNKTLLHDLSGNLNIPNILHTSQNDSLYNKLDFSQLNNSELNSKNFKKFNENNSSNSKFNPSRKDNIKKKGKLFLQKNNLIKSIRINKNNCFDKGNKNTLNKKIKMKILPYLKTNINLNYNHKENHLKKSNKIKESFEACKLSNEQIKKLENRLTENNLKYKKLVDRANKKIQDLKIYQSGSESENKNINFYSNYIKNNKILIKNFLNAKRNFTNPNISSFIKDNNSEIITNQVNTNINKNKNNTLKNKKKKKHSFFHKECLLKEDDTIKIIKNKLKTKGLTTKNSKDKSKFNILNDNIANTNAKNKNSIYSNKNKNNKKIYINNIININNTNENNNIFENDFSYSNDLSLRILGANKLKSFKNNVIELSSNYLATDYPLFNQSQRIICHKKSSNPDIRLKELKSNNNKNKNDNKFKTIKANVINKINRIKCQKINPKNLKLNKERLLKKEKNIPIEINKIYESSEMLSNKPHSKNLSKKFLDFIAEYPNEKNNRKKNNNDNNINIINNPSISSTIKNCEYYKQECKNLASYIKDYYKKHNSYPKTELNFYKYGRLLGKGAFGKVNIALHLASGRLVAIKSFNKKKLTTSREKRKIKTEIEVLSKLRNPFCTQIYDYFETDTHILIVMEYVCGDLLSFMRKRSKISESTAKIIFKQIIKGLQYIHNKKIVHRDIKLDNVLMDLTNTVKICDFGVSKILQPGDIMYEHCGTPSYIAPELFKDEGYEGFSCDIWSAGVTLYYMLAGVQPFKGTKIEDIKKVILKGEYEPIQDISAEANDLINHMLKLNPKERITIKEILKHPWLKNVDIKNRKNLNLFTNAEKVLLAKYDVNYFSSPKEELIEVFTTSNLETKDEKDLKGVTKSEILAPYNTYVIFPDMDNRNDIKIENNICRFNFKAQLSNLKYELSNNQEFDNGIIKTIYNSVENDYDQIIKNKDKEMSQSLNLSLDSAETFTCCLYDDIIKDIEEIIGYNKKYLVKCIRNNEINYATATYYLMLKDELNTNF